MVGNGDAPYHNAQTIYISQANPEGLYHHFPGQFPLWIMYGIF